jgi:hypothetical protein
LHKSLSSLRFFMVYLRPASQIPGQSFKLDHDQFLPNPFQLIIYCHPIILIYRQHHEINYKYIRKTSVALFRERIMPTERPPLVGEVSANFCG